MVATNLYLIIKHERSVLFRNYYYQRIWFLITMSNSFKTAFAHFIHILLGVNKLICGSFNAKNCTTIIKESINRHKVSITIIIILRHFRKFHKVLYRTCYTDEIALSFKFSARLYSLYFLVIPEFTMHSRLWILEHFN